ncbi:hypothetical protein QTP70_019178 [Hemibagrus guttatus]|uniref:Uncharacterized protein n=1 Tax=Hemibagrus guttatus TaxID=175788 RepID=A0AAE0VD51_9TELE|nr:hypothetical protein QTP70_019178 [Hemibagrus guttatus]
MADSHIVPPCKLHRLFRVYDPEVVAVKTCVYASGFGLLAGLCAIIVYGYAVNYIMSENMCESVGIMQKDCQEEHDLVGYFKSISTLLLIYDMGALTLEGLILFSAVKGLKTN